MGKALKNNQGITLIALVITIIVMLILAGISAYAAFGEDGLIERAIAARENKEMEELLEKSEVIKARLESEEADGGQEVTKDSLLDAIKDKLGSGRDENKVVSKDKKYDIFVDDELNITVKKHQDGNNSGGDSGDGDIGGGDTGGGDTDGGDTGGGDAGVEEPDFELDPVLMPITEEAEILTRLTFYLNVEKYYPDLLEVAVVRFFNRSLGIDFNDINDLKSYLIDNNIPPFSEMTPENISINDILSNLGVANSGNEFFNRKLGAMFIMDTEEQRRKFLLEANRNIYISFNSSVVGNMTDDELVQYFMDEGWDNDGNGYLSNDELLNFFVAAFYEPDIEEAWWELYLNDIIGGNEPQLVATLNNYSLQDSIVSTIIPDLIVDARGEFTIKSKTSYTVEKSQTCNFTVITPEYEYILLDREPIMMPQYEYQTSIDLVAGGGYYEATDQFIDSNGDIIWIPEGFKPVRETSTAVSGFKIRDKKANYFVWVPVSDSDYSKMFNTSTGKGKLYSFNTSGTATYMGEEVVASADQTEFNNMRESIKKYKGFYVAERESLLKDGKPLLRQYTIFTGAERWGTYGAMFDAQKKLDTNSKAVTSHMIWDCQWDRIMQWVNSASFNVGKGQADRHEYSIVSTDHASDVAKGILNLEACVNEWTSNASVRGGTNKNVFNTGFVDPAAKRVANVNKETTHGSRLTLYIK